MVRNIGKVEKREIKRLRGERGDDKREGQMSDVLIGREEAVTQVTPVTSAIVGVERTKFIICSVHVYPSE